MLLTIEEITSEIIDKRGVTVKKLGGDFVENGHRVISAKLIKNSKIDLNAGEERFVNKEIYKKWMSSKLMQGDVILTSEAPLGKVAYVQEDLDWCLGQRLFCLRPNTEILDGRYLFYSLKTRKVQADLESRGTGTTVLGIKQSELLKVQIPVQDIEVQKRISALLGRLDNKIELNQKMNETLEEIAKTLFKSWFIDFDPVRAKAEGRPTGLSKEISDLFPDSFEDSELSEIPKGWTVTQLDNVADFQNGYTFSSKEYELPTQDSKEVFRMGYIKRGGGFKEDNTPVFVPISSKGNQQRYMLCKDDLTISMTDMKNNMQILGCCALVEEDERFLLNQRVGRIRVKECFHIGPHYLYIYMNYPKNIDLLRSRSNSGVQVNLSTSTIKETKIVLPTKKLSQYFSDITKPIYSKISLNNIESKNLKKIIDILLPKLISGELQIPEAENLIKEVGI